jgi:hypothetical protein
MPVCNSASFLETVEVPLQFEVTVVDAASTDRSVEIAEQRGWAVSKKSHRVGRVENWENAVRHFVHSQAPWCKWLFTGDTLYPDAHDILMTAILNVPQARLVVCEYDIVENGRKTRWKMFPTTRLLSPPQTLWLTAKQGNWFGSPVGQCFHREAVAEEFSFGPWVWAADMQFCYNISKQWPVLYVAESVGEFHVEARKTFSAQCNALSSSVEEYLVRAQAARDYLQATEDRSGYEQLSQALVQETEALIVARAFNRSADEASVEHLFSAIPLMQLAKGLGRRLWKKARGA